MGHHLIARAPHCLAYILLQQNKKTLVMKQRLNFFLFIYLFICPICQLEGRSMIEPAKEPGDYITSNSKFIFFKLLILPFRFISGSIGRTNQGRYLKKYFCIFAPIFITSAILTVS